VGFSTPEQTPRQRHGIGLRLARLVAGVALALPVMAGPLVVVSATPVAAATTCATKTLNLFYMWDYTDTGYTYLRIHVTGCYNGTTSWASTISRGSDCSVLGTGRNYVAFTNDRVLGCDYGPWVGVSNNGTQQTWYFHAAFHGVASDDPEIWAQIYLNRYGGWSGWMSGDWVSINGCDANGCSGGHPVAGNPIVLGWLSS
jgi:hypothetical protein